jgi:signal transduction histidine kinase
MIFNFIQGTHIEVGNRNRCLQSRRQTANASAANPMIYFTEDLLLLARTDQVNQLKQAMVDLTDVLNRLVTLCQPQATAKEV